MKKLLALLVIGLSVNGGIRAAESIEEWHNIMAAAKKTVLADKEMQHALEQVTTDIQKLLTLATKKIAQQVTTPEREKLASVVNILKRIVDKYEAVIKAGSFDDVSMKTKEEISQLGQELMITVMPLLYLMQNPALVQDAGANDNFLQTVTLQAYNGVKRVITNLDKEMNTLKK